MNEAFEGKIVKGRATAGMYYARAGSPQLEAWDVYRQSTNGQPWSRDRAGGCFVPFEWPPSVQQQRDVVINPRFRLRPFNGITVSLEPVYLVKGLIPRAGLALVWGPPKCGKSFWAFDLVMHVALSRKYCGRPVQHGTVVYLALEGCKGFEARIEAFRQRFLPEDADEIPFFLIGDAVNLVKDQTDLILCIRLQAKDNPVVVVIDTLNRSLVGSESDDKDMAAYIRAADAIRNAFGCAVIILHHCGVDDSRPRGHTSLIGAVDAQLAVKRDAAGDIVVTVQRMKDGPEGDSVVSRLETVEVGNDIDGDPITSCVVVPVDSALLKPTAKRLSPTQVLARRSLAELLCDDVATHTISLPSGTVRAVRLEDWRARCERDGFGADAIPDSRRRMFQRVREKLQVSCVIGVRDGLVWLERVGETQK
jgi:hypothetical protein